MTNDKLYLITEEQLKRLANYTFDGFIDDKELMMAKDIFRELRSHPYNPQADPCQECDDSESCDEICKYRKEIRHSEREKVLDELIQFCEDRIGGYCITLETMGENAYRSDPSIKRIEELEVIINYCKALRQEGKVEK